MNPVEIVERFWAAVWQPPHDFDAIDRMVAEDFVLTNAGVDIVGREAFKTWARGFAARIGITGFESVETFSSADGTRVTSRWIITREGMPAITGTAVWAVRPDGLLEHNWVERSAQS
jgi:SnoaL-like domain